MTTTSIKKEKIINETIGITIKERGMIPLLEKEIVDLLKGQEIPGMVKYYCRKIR